VRERDRLRERNSVREGGRVCVFENVRVRERERKKKEIEIEKFVSFHL
jgi:hypothetical protein